MDRYETLALARDARGVLTITLNRPDKKNALSGQMIADLTHIACLLYTSDAADE